MVKVSIMSRATRNQSGIAKASGKPYSIDFQTAYFHLVNKSGVPDPFPTKVEIMLEKNDQGQPVIYPEGNYTLAPGSVYVDRQGNLSISPRLVKLAA